MEKAALTRAIEIVGSQSELARRCKVAPQAVHQWVLSGSVPAKRLRAVEMATGNKVKRHELRPDIFESDE